MSAALHGRLVPVARALDGVRVPAERSTKTLLGDPLFARVASSRFASLWGGRAFAFRRTAS